MEPDLTVTITGPGWLCQPVLPPAAILICCVTMPVEPSAFRCTPVLLLMTRFGPAVGPSVPRACTGAPRIPTPGVASAAPTASRNPSPTAAATNPRRLLMLVLPFIVLSFLGLRGGSSVRRQVGDFLAAWHEARKGVAARLPSRQAYSKRLTGARTGREASPSARMLGHLTPPER